jgi:hypothetical protein
MTDTDNDIYEELTVLYHVEKAIRRITWELLLVSKNPTDVRKNFNTNKMMTIKMKLKNIRDLIEK